MTTETREVLYRLRGDTADLDSASAAAAGALRSIETAMGRVAAEAGRTQAASQAFERQQQQSIGTLRQVAQWETTLANIRKASADKQAGLTRTQGDFLRGLERQAAEAGKTRAELLGMQAAQLGVASQAAPLIARLGVAEKSVKGVASGTKLTSQEMLTLNYTMSDVAASLASGGSPFTILLQQGGQVRDSFGGFGNLFTKLGALITPTRLAIGGVAAAVGLLVVAYAQGYAEDKKLRDSLALTGNRAGLTRDSFYGLAAQIQASADVTIGAARDIAQALVSTGQIGPPALAAVGSAAAQVARLTGSSADEVVKDFASMSSGVAKWAAQHNKSYNYLTVEQYKYIRALEAQGRTEEAMRVNADLLDKALKGRAEQLGSLERGWRNIKEAASGAWNAMLNVGRPETVGDQLEQARAALVRAQENRAAGGAGYRPTTVQTPGGVAQAQRLVDDLVKQQFRELDRANEQAVAARDTQKQIEQEGDAFRNSQISKEQAGFVAMQAQRDLAREKERIATQRAYDELAISAQAFRARMYALDQAALADKLRAIEQEALAETKRTPADEAGRIAQEARMVEIRSRRFAVERDLVRLAEDERSGRRDPQARAVVESPQAAFRQAELEQQAAVEEGLKTRRESAATFARDLRETNAALSADLIRDDRARGEALLALEAENLRKRMDIGALAGEERLRAEEEFSQFVLLRQQQLNEELKPEWQRMLDDWRDTNKLMKDAGDDFATGFLREGEDAFVQFAAKGKVSVKGLVDFTLAELARLQYRKLIGEAGGAGGLFGAIAGLFGGGNVPVGDGTGATGDFARFDRSLTVASARGNAFAAGSVEAFARGGILGPNGGLLTRPTIFPMANGGIGLGGEAGTEAVMPLKRGANGKLGVAVNGGGNSAPAFNVVINNTVSNEVEATARPNDAGQLEVTVRRIVRDENARDINSGGGPISSGLKSRGVNLSGNLPRRK